MTVLLMITEINQPKIWNLSLFGDYNNDRSTLQMSITTFDPYQIIKDDTQITKSVRAQINSYEVLSTTSN